MKTLFTLLVLLFIANLSFAQEKSLNYFLEAAQKNNPSLLQNENLKRISGFENQLITAENSTFHIDATSEVMVAPYFNNDGRFIAITTTPSPNAYGYAEPVSNGSLYSAQVNITKDIFNRSKVQNLLFQNKLNNKARELSNEEIIHQLQKNVTQAYIQVYQLQLQQSLTKDLISDLENRLKVVEILVKKGILMQSDYLLLQLEIDQKKLQYQQMEINLNANLLNLNNAVGIKNSEIQKLEAPLLPLDPQLKEYLSKGDISTKLSNFKDDSLDLKVKPLSINSMNRIEPDSSQTFYKRKYKIDSLQLVSEQAVFNNKYKPQLTAYGNTGLNAVDANDIPHNFGFSAGLKLVVPIYDGGQKKIKELQKELRNENLKVQLQNKELIKQNTLESLQQQITGVYKGLVLIEKQLEKQRNIMEIYKGKMVQGQVSIIDYLKVIENYKIDMETKLQMQVNLWLLQNEYNATNW